ncbi:MAG: hypothetical protein JNK15_18995 [Planctomycetes bacterium]|nr:hypothetical protein [Planctomycetota bacterium]
MTEAPRDQERYGPRFHGMLVTAAIVPIVWLAVIGGSQLLPCAVLVVPVSVVLWWVAFRVLEGIAPTRLRLFAALGIGLLSPLVGLAFLALPMSCIPRSPIAWMVAWAAMVMVEQPLWFLPFGLGMGLVAFLLVRPVPRPEA